MLTTFHSWGSAFCRCVVASEWNVEGGRLRVVMVVFLVFFWLLDVGLTDWAIVRGFCRDAGKSFSNVVAGSTLLTDFRIVEYATREQAQSAVSTLSNQNLMGRLVYVREVRVTNQAFGCRHTFFHLGRATPDCHNNWDT